MGLIGSHRENVLTYMVRIEVYVMKQAKRKITPKIVDDMKGWCKYNCIST